eukprot:1197420-Prymnesium_polylepis.1
MQTTTAPSDDALVRVHRSLLCCTRGVDVHRIDAAVYRAEGVSHVLAATPLAAPLDAVVVLQCEDDILKAALATAAVTRSGGTVLLWSARPALAAAIVAAYLVRHEGFHLAAALVCGRAVGRPSRLAI